MGRVSGKVAVVTGGANGIGRAASHRLAAAGAAVVVGDVDESSALEVARQIERGGGRAVGCRLDAMDEDSIRALVDGAVDRLGALHVMCNHVGGSDPRRDLDLLRLDLAEFDRQIKKARIDTQLAQAKGNVAGALQQANLSAEDRHVTESALSEIARRAGRNAALLDEALAAGEQQSRSRAVRGQA